MMEKVEGNMPQKSNDDRTRNIIVIVCVIVAVIIAVSLGVRYAKQQAELDKLKELAEQSQLPNLELVAEDVVEDVVEEPVEEVENAPMTIDEKIEWYQETFGIEVPDKNLDFADLQENTNADIYAWIYIPNTQIDYPVLQHPTDNYYYLNYNLDGSKGYPGCIYTEDYNAKDFSDPLTVMYGHNMKNGSMFAGLHKFEDSAFFKENPYVYIYTENDVLVYEIFAAYQNSDAHLLYEKDYTSEIVFESYLEEVLGQRSMTANIREDVAVNGTDKVLTLSTCIANKPDKRYLVQGVLLYEN